MFIRRERGTNNITPNLIGNIPHTPSILNLEYEYIFNGICLFDWNMV